MVRFINIAVILFLLNNNEAARILAVIPTASISHQVVFRPLTQELAKRGHEVVVITTDPAFPKGQAPENLIEIDVHNVSYTIWRKQMQRLENNLKDQVDGFIRAYLTIFEEQTKVPEVQDIIVNKSNRFDLLLVESWMRFALGYSLATKGQSIAISSFGAVEENYDVIGAPTHPFVYPLTFNSRVFDLTIWEKICQYYEQYWIKRYFERTLERDNAVVKRIFGENIKSLRELQNNVQMFLLNLHPVWDNYRPMPPGVLYMGGIHQKPRKELPEDIKTYLNSSVHGVIYVSFGTNVDPGHLPPEKIQTIIRAFDQLPYDVLFKWNQDELPGRTKNIKISKWLPQSDLLRHPNIKLFITQGGLQSTEEAITAGVPLVCIPMMGDQWYNAEKYVHHKVGLKIDINTMSVDSLKRAIDTVIGDKSYRENMVWLRTITTDQPMSAIDRAVWWTEYVLRHGGATHLRSPAASMPWRQYYEIELVFIVLTVAMTVAVFTLWVLSKILKIVLRKVANDLNAVVCGKRQSTITTLRR